MPVDSYGFNNPVYDGADGGDYIDVDADAGAVSSKKGRFVYFQGLITRGL